MDLSRLEFFLPPSLIAQKPLFKKGEARLMVVNRKTGDIIHSKFGLLKDFLVFGDLLVLNNVKVKRCKISASKQTGGSVELTFLSENIAIAKGRLKPGNILKFANFQAEVKEKLQETPAIFRLEIQPPLSEKDLQKYAEIPLPPYIKGKVDERDYQTVYARKPAALAAPTAGLHFSKRHLKSLRKLGIVTAYLTLNVGLGTFLPIRTQKVEDHKMFSEDFEIPARTAQLVNENKLLKRRVIAVGTTTVRALETAAVWENDRYLLKPGSSRTDLFILPGYQFKIVDALITNFHLPKSTLLALVFAFAGEELIKKAYREAIKLGYRFYSFGDAMLII
jgi:S-adenosylmethionine:tRNA ribosyltransferase-isomerase